MAFNPIIEGSPFDGFFEAHLPRFFFEKFKGNDLTRIQSILSNMEVAFDNIYQNVKDFPDELDNRTADVKFLHKLIGLLGIDDLDDLSSYFDEDGNLDTALITQDQYDKLYIQQKTYIANVVAGYLLKGTTESIVRLLQSYGINSSIRELWTEDVINGPYFKYENSLITRYGTAITGSVSGDIYTEDEPNDIISELSSTVPSASGIGDIEQFEMNNYGYKYLLDGDNNLYYKTSTSVEVSGSAEETWYEYDSSLLATSISGDISEFKLLNDKIFLKTNANDLAVLDYRLDDITIVPDFSIDNNDCLFFDFIENGNYIFLDRDNVIEVRNVVDYQRLAISIAKPVGNTEAVNQIILKKNKDYLIINNNKKGYILAIDDVVETYNLNTPATVYDLLIESDEVNYKAFRIHDEEITILKFNTTTADVKASYLLFDDVTLTATSLLLSEEFIEINDYHQYSERVLLISDSKLGIFNLTDKSIEDYDYITPSYNYKKVFDLELFYFLRFDGADLDLTKITGWNSFKVSLYKTHYFDLIVDADVLNDITDIDVTSETLKEFIEELILLLKPIHTEFRTLISTTLTELEELLNDVMLIGDDSFLSGQEFTLYMKSLYNGIHAWKRDNAEPLRYKNDGIDGRPLVRYGQTSFNFEQDTSNTDLDNLLYYNTPLP